MNLKIVASEISVKNTTSHPITDHLSSFRAPSHGMTAFLDKCNKQLAVRVAIIQPNNKYTPNRIRNLLQVFPRLEIKQEHANHEAMQPAAWPSSESPKLMLQYKVKHTVNLVNPHCVLHNSSSQNTTIRANLTLDKERRILSLKLLYDCLLLQIENSTDWASLSHPEPLSSWDT